MVKRYWQLVLPFGAFAVSRGQAGARLQTLSQQCARMLPVCMREVRVVVCHCPMAEVPPYGRSTVATRQMLGRVPAEHLPHCHRPRAKGCYPGAVLRSGQAHSTPRRTLRAGAGTSHRKGGSTQTGTGLRVLPGRGSWAPPTPRHTLRIAGAGTSHSLSGGST